MPLRFFWPEESPLFTLTRSIPRLLGPTAYLCPQHLDSRKDKSLSLWFSKEELRLLKRNFARLLGWGPANRQRQTTCRSLSLRSLRTSPCPTCPKFPLPSYCLAKRAQESTKSQGPQVTILARTQWLCHFRQIDKPFWTSASSSVIITIK